MYLQIIRLTGSIKVFSFAYLSDDDHPGFDLHANFGNPIVL